MKAITFPSLKEVLIKALHASKNTVSTHIKASSTSDKAAAVTPKSTALIVGIPPPKTNIS